MGDRLTKEQVNLILQGTENDWVDYISWRLDGRRIPGLEPYIAEHPRAAARYARKVIGGRWPEAEPMIAKSEWAQDYAEDVIRDRWPEAEPYIKRRPWMAAMYAAKVIQGRWPEAEPLMRRYRIVWEWYTTFCPKAKTQRPKRLSARRK